MSRTSLLVHIGYYKTATTWLQRFLFNGGAGLFDVVLERDEVLRQIANLRDYEFTSERIRALLKKRMDRTIHRNRIPVISEERLCGRAFSGLDGGILCRRLGTIAPEAKILICVREQKAMVSSMYAHTLRRTCFQVSLNSFLNHERYDGRWYAPIFKRSFLEYDTLVKLYMDAFGSSNVAVLPYEMFLQDKWKFIEKLYSFVGREVPLCRKDTGFFDVRVNADGPISQKIISRSVRTGATCSKRLPVLSNIIYLALPPRFRKFIHNALIMKLAQKSELRIRARIAKTIKKELGGVYCKSNRRLSQLIGWDLNEYGYEM